MKIYCCEISWTFKKQSLFGKIKNQRQSRHQPAWRSLFTVRKKTPRSTTIPLDTTALAAASSNHSMLRLLPVISKQVVLMKTTTATTPVATSTTVRSTVARQTSSTTGNWCGSSCTRCCIGVQWKVPSVLLTRPACSVTKSTICSSCFTDPVPGWPVVGHPGPESPTYNEKKHENLIKIEKFYATYFNRRNLTKTVKKIETKKHHQSWRIDGSTWGNCAKMRDFTSCQAAYFLQEGAVPSSKSRAISCDEPIKLLRKFNIFGTLDI